MLFMYIIIIIEKILNDIISFLIYKLNECLLVFVEFLVDISMGILHIYFALKNILNKIMESECFYNFTKKTIYSPIFMMMFFIVAIILQIKFNSLVHYCEPRDFESFKALKCQNCEVIINSQPTLINLPPAQIRNTLCPLSRFVSWPDADGNLWTNDHWDFICILRRHTANGYRNFFIEIEALKDSMDSMINIIQSGQEVSDVSSVFAHHDPYGTFNQDPFLKVVRRFHNTSPTVIKYNLITVEFQKFKVNWQELWNTSKHHGLSYRIESKGTPFWFHTDDIIKVPKPWHRIWSTGSIDWSPIEYHIPAAANRPEFVREMLKNYCINQSAILGKILDIESRVANIVPMGAVARQGM